MWFRLPRPNNQKFAASGVIASKAWTMKLTHLVRRKVSFKVATDSSQPFDKECGAPLLTLIKQLSYKCNNHFTAGEIDPTCKFKVCNHL